LPDGLSDYDLLKDYGGLLWRRIAVQHEADAAGENRSFAGPRSYGFRNGMAAHAIVSNTFSE
jgi:hypothetical protein